MNLIQEFYKNLDALELIIFWGIIIVLILVVILIIILVNKKQKKHKIVTNEMIEELPIKIDEISKEDEVIVNDVLETNFDKTEENNLLEEIEPIIEPEEIKIQKTKEENKYQTSFEIPSAPYQKNVLREMSLSQTSPIGINRKNDYIKPQELFEMYNKHEEELETNESEIKKETGKTEEPVEEKIQEVLIEEKQKDDLDIERTKYEIEQEENAIISYKELMEKKDSIQTIDEEDAIISIEELLNKTNNKEEIKKESKLYNISENEENDSFINELKQFRKDL